MIGVILRNVCPLLMKTKAQADACARWGSGVGSPESEVGSRKLGNLSNQRKRPLVPKSSPMYGLVDFVASGFKI